MRSNLNLHSGGHVVTRQELALYIAPPPTSTWHPTSHVDTLDLITETLGNAGYHVTDQRLAVHRDGARFFSVLDLASTIVDGLTLAIGVRNSYDMSFPYGLVGGTRTFVCSNLSFSGDLINVRRKHTLNGQARFREATSLAIANLADFQQVERRRIESFQAKALEDRDASHLILQAYRREIISHRALPHVIDHWEEPRHDFGPPSVYSLLQAFTSVLTDRVKTAPQVFAAQTIALTGLLSGFVGLDSPDLIDITPQEATEGHGEQAEF